MEHLHHHTFFNMFFDEISKAHCAWILSCSGPVVGIWFTVQLNFPAFQLFSLVFATTFHMWLGLPYLSIVGILQCVCTHPIDRMSIHLLCCAHGNERTETHDAIHDTVCHYCVRCWIPCAKRTIACASFNHIQFLLSTSWHCAYQRWHLHPSWCCHCWPNASKFTSLILHNSRICRLQCSLSQWKELSQLTPH